MGWKWDKEKQEWVQTGDSGGKKAQPQKGYTAKDIETARLQFRSAKLAAKAGKKPDKGGGSPSIFSRTMDVLSRPAYASAEATRAALGKGGRSGVGGSLLDAVVGAGRGAAGTKKTSYSHVLEEQGVKNKWVRGAVGLAGDILLDPSTYVGIGLVGKGGKIAKVAEGAKGTKTVADVATASKKSGALDEIATKARQAYYDDAMLKGVGKEVSEKKISSQAKKIGKEAARQEQERLIVETSKILPPVGPRKLSIKMAGQPLGAISYPGTVVREGMVGSKVAGLGKVVGKGLSLPKKQLAQTDFGQGLAELGGDLGSFFSNKALLGPLAASRRVFSGRSAAELETWVDAYGWKKLPLKDYEAEQFTHAYESGLMDEFIVSTGGKSKKGVDYGELAERVRKANHELLEHDKNAFMIDPENPTGIVKSDAPEVENYLHHQYRNKGGRETKAERRKAIAKGEKPLTLKEAKARGLNPETDIRVIMMNRAAKSFSGQARGNYVTDAVDQFGMRLDNKTLKIMESQGHELVNLKKKLKSTMKKGDQDDFIDTLPDDIYVDGSIAKYLEGAEKIYRTPEEFSRILRLLDGVQNRLKAAQTVYNPGHHLRNANTDILLSAIGGGVISPRPYDKAARVMWGPYDTVTKTFRRDKALQGSTKINRQRVSNIDIRRVFKETGASPGFQATDIEAGSRILKGRVTRIIHKASQEREEYVRFAHWIHALEREAKGMDLSNLDNLTKAGLKAADEVRHWHIDYTDLTPFERTFMKRVIPYYTWMRHSTPLMLEAMATRPGRVAAIPKSMGALETMIGLDPEDVLPEWLTPKWLRDANAVQLGTKGDNPLFMSPPNPIADTLRMGEGGTKGILGNLASQLSSIYTPKAAFELGTGRTTFGGGVPIKSTSDYLLGQVPIARQYGTITSNIDDPDKSDTWTRVMQYLTGAGLYEATPNRIKGELHRQIDTQEGRLRKLRGR